MTSHGVAVADQRFIIPSTPVPIQDGDLKMSHRRLSTTRMSAGELGQIPLRPTFVPSHHNSLSITCGSLGDLSDGSSRPTTQSGLSTTSWRLGDLSDGFSRPTTPSGLSTTSWRLGDLSDGSSRPNTPSSIVSVEWGDEAVQTFVDEHQYTFNQRTYYKPDCGRPPWPLPIDEEERVRKYAELQLFRITFGGLFRAPLRLEKMSHVLDLRAGFVTWADEFARCNKHITVYCISEHIPPRDYEPPFMPMDNTEVFVGDILDWRLKGELESSIAGLDYIRVEGLKATGDKWKQVLVWAEQQLKPGGYIEIWDKSCPLQCDGDPLGLDRILIECSERLVAAAASEPFKFDPTASMESERLLADAGFVNIRKETPKWYLRPHSDASKSQTFSQNTRCVIMEEISLQSMAYFTQALQWSSEKVEVSLIDVRKGIEDPSSRAYVPIVVSFAQKPR